MSANAVRRAIVLLSLGAVCAGGAASAEEVETRDLSGFSAIEVGGSVDLDVTQGSAFEVVVRGSAEALARLSTEVSGTTLQIRQQPTTSRWFGFGSFESVEVSVTLPELASLVATGGADVRTQGRFSGARLALEASGGSDVTLDLDVTELVISTSGGSDTTLTGTAERMEVRSSGGSDLSAAGLTTDELSVRSSGGSDVTVNVSRRLLVDASGGSDVFYTGDPEFVDIDSSGGADVHRR